MIFTIKKVITLAICLPLLFMAYKVLFLNNLLFWPHGWSKESAYVVAFSLGMFSLAYLLTSLTGQPVKSPKGYQTNREYQE